MIAAVCCAQPADPPTFKTKESGEIKSVHSLFILLTFYGNRTPTTPITFLYYSNVSELRRTLCIIAPCLIKQKWALISSTLPPLRPPPLLPQLPYPPNCLRPLIAWVVFGRRRATATSLAALVGAIVVVECTSFFLLTPLPCLVGSFVAVEMPMALWGIPEEAAVVEAGVGVSKRPP